MRANLIEIRKKDFVSQDTKETIEGYVATFLVSSYKSDYPPSLVSFYLSAEHYLTYLLLRKLDVSKINPVYCELTGIAMFDIGYDYNKEKTWQKLKYVR
jgi:hypothetical protein